MIVSLWKLSGPLLLALIFGLLLPATALHAADTREFESDIELTNFAFANYLGSGFYSSSGIQVFIVKLPFSTTLKEATRTEAGWVVHYPVSLGLTNIKDNLIGVGDIPGLDDIGTISVVPGLEYIYPMLSNWHLQPFIDFGIARDVSSGVDVRVRGVGVKSYATFDFDRSWLVFANRLFYADQKNLESGNESSFAVFETGLDYTIPTNITIDGSAVNVSYYFINYTYLDDLVLLDLPHAQISLENKNEVGFTFTLPKHSWLPDDSRIGLGVQVTKNTELYRIVLGAPFF
ncbi:MAG: hypothetical protein GY785_06765 [Gammaproteobacteria bacterium]|nr:hypothetical protein [Gammaproteobacteria bacterium]